MKNVIVLGDFNAYQDFSEPVDIFTSKDTTLCSFLRPGAPLFKDAVVASLKSDQRAPFTFSNMVIYIYIYMFLIIIRYFKRQL